MSETVIGDVMQRTRKASTTRGEYAERKEINTEMRSYQQRYRQAPYQKTVQANSPDTSENGAKTREGTSPGTAIFSSIAELMGPIESSPGRKHQSFLSSDLQTVNKIIVSIQGTNHNITAELQQAIIAKALKMKIRYRERCRVNQIRYRKRQQKVETDIRVAIAKLQLEIGELEMKCKDSSRLPITPTLWAIAAEYFRHFRYYVSSPGMVHTTASKFLHEIMAPDVMDGSLLGVEPQLENWRLFTLYFDEVHLELKGMQMPTADTLVADTITIVTITINTLCRAFPHLNSDGSGGTKGGVWLPLAARILGQKLVMRGTVLFGWDNSTDKVVSFHSQTDMLTPMLDRLGSLEDVSCVFDQALITPECRFVRRQ